ncbi:MAG: hypothetical protein CMJ81_21750 [Planctomycetaceae bacterium]|nr:hypothetical protein [Planctomycetaceae bacterium]MBP60860.1 hypothetical protein [Planctomycetaceae bacterium]
MAHPAHNSHRCLPALQTEDTKEVAQTGANRFFPRSKQAFDTFHREWSNSTLLMEAGWPLEKLSFREKLTIFPAIPAGVTLFVRTEIAL